ncbi:MAG: sialate O-acetylesterase, partial [Verrucomicrobiota bacterium]
MERSKFLTAGIGMLFAASTGIAENPINDKLPAPDGKPADMSKPVQVFILMGQSNMLEFGKVKGDKDGNLDYAVKKEGLYPFLLDEAGNWTTRQDVRNVAVMGSGGPGKMKVRYNSWMTVGGKVGVEIGVGHQLGNAIDAPVLILKSAIGNRSLGWDLLPPGSPSWEVEEKNRKTGEVKTMVYAGYGQSPGKWEKGTEPKPIGWKAGLQYDGDVARAKEVLADLDKYYPGATGYEVAGFVWWQGCKDRGNPAHFNRYEQHLVALIKSLRKDFNAPNAKFVAASLGEDEIGVQNGGGKILEAIMNVADSQKYPEFKGSVAGVYSYPLKGGRGGSCGHYGGNAKTYMNVGLGLGEAMARMIT